jgi:hypothetical protein
MARVAVANGPARSCTLAQTVLGLLGLLLLHVSAAIVATDSFDPSGPFYVSTQIDELRWPTSSLDIISPVSLRGRLRWALTPYAGPMLTATGPDYNVTVRVILPNSLESDQHGCGEPRYTHNDEGEEYKGAVLLFMQDNGCPTEKIIANWGKANVLAVAIALFRQLKGFGNSRIDPVASMALSGHDGQILYNYLTGRRAWLARQPAPSASHSVNCSSTTSIDYSAPVICTLVGTGSTDPGDIAALQAIAQQFNVYPPSLTYNSTTTSLSWSALHDWKQMAESGHGGSYTAFDPCLDRLAGIWCERGRVVSVHLEGLGLDGTMSPAVGNLTALRDLSVGLGNQWLGLTGGVPDSICGLPLLRILAVHENLFTSLPDCLGDMPSLQVLLGYANRFRTLPASIGGLNDTLFALDMHANRLTEIPSELFSLTQMLVLNLQQNALRLTCSDLNFTSWRKVDSILLSRVGLTGQCRPDAFDGLAMLRMFDVSFNEISGAVPNFDGCAGLRTLILTANQFSGAVPTLTTNTALQTLYLGSNDLFGDLPARSEAEQEPQPECTLFLALLISLMHDFSPFLLLGLLLLLLLLL